MDVMRFALALFGDAFFLSALLGMLAGDFWGAMRDAQEREDAELFEFCVRFGGHNEIV